MPQLRGCTVLNVPQFNGTDVVEQFSVSVFEVNCHASRMKITARMPFVTGQPPSGAIQFDDGFMLAFNLAHEFGVICINKALNVWIHLKEEECKTIPIITTSFSNLAQQKLDRHLHNMLTTLCYPVSLHCLSLSCCTSCPSLLRTLSVGLIISSNCT